MNEKTTFQIEDALRMRTLTIRTPSHLSPDGEWLAYSVQDPLLRDPHLKSVSGNFLPSGAPLSVAGSAVWAAHLPTGRSECLTPEGTAWAPRWSPDGRSLAFYSDRDGRAGLWVWGRETGNTCPVNSTPVRASHGFEGPQWEPGGGRILVKLPPSDGGREGEPRSSSTSSGDQVTASKVTVWQHPPPEEGPMGERVNPHWPAFLENYKGRLARVDVNTGETEELTSDLYTYNWQISPDGSHVALLGFAGFPSPTEFVPLWDLLLISLETGTARRLVEKIPQETGFHLSWSPKGDALAYTSGSDVYRISVSGGEPHPLTAGQPVRCFSPQSEERPQWSADGRFLYFVSGGRLSQIPSEGGAVTSCAPEGRSVVGIVKRSDGLSVWQPGEGTVGVMTLDPESKRSGVASLDSSTGAWQTLYEDEVHLGGALSFRTPDGEEKVLVVSESPVRPPDFWTVDPTFIRWTQVTHLNPHAEGCAFGGVERVEWTGEDGVSGRGALMLPAGHAPGRKVPVILQVYAGDSLSDQLFRFGLGHPGRGNLQILAGRGFGVLAVDVDLRTSDPLKEIETRIAPAVERLVELGIADPDRVGIMGHSYGGYSVNALITRTTRFRAAVSSAGVSDLVSHYLSLDEDASASRMRWTEWGQGGMGGPLWEQRPRYIENSPVFFLDAVETPVLILHGEEDRAVPVRQSIELYAGLRRLDKTATLVRYAGEGHDISTGWSLGSVRDRWERIIDWFERYL